MSLSRSKTAIATLLLIVPILTELLSGNTPFLLMLNPLVFGFLLIMYGVPVLLAREAAVRWNLGILGLLTLGIAYGILNEGVAARTLLLSDEHMFIANLRGYSTFGINLPWAMAILPWHALFSIVYPIAIIHSLYPDIAKVGWLSKRTIQIMSVIVVLIASLSYFSTDKYPATPPSYLFFFWIVIAILIYFARRLRGEPLSNEVQSPKGHRSAFFLGISMITLFFTPIILGATKFPQLVQLGMTGVFLAIFYYAIRKNFSFKLSSLARIGLGDYLAGALLGLTAIGGAGILGALVVLSLLFWLWRRICREEASRLDFLVK